jgi:hypothetical protein
MIKLHDYEYASLKDGAQTALFKGPVRTAL